MSGLIVELILSWLLLWICFRKGLPVLGFAPSKARVLQLVTGFAIAAVCGVLYYASFSLFNANRWIPNPSYNAAQFFAATRYTLQSVLYEELLFRGALLYILLKKAGLQKACLLSAISFGVYHWFTFEGVLGNPVQMAVVFIMTGIWGAMFALSFALTKSLYLPVGLHFGWNLTSSVIFSAGPLGRQLFILDGKQPLGEPLSAIVIIFQVLSVPALTWWYLRVQSNKQRGRDKAVSPGDEIPPSPGNTTLS